MRKTGLLIFVFILIMLSGLSAAAMADTARSACLMNSVTGEVLFEKDADTPMPMASTTKIMTLITAIENSEPDELVTVPHEAVLEEGSSAYIEEGSAITMRELFYGLMLNSGNDAAVAIACHISGSEAEFAGLMNRKAQEIGVRNTNFMNANGLDEDGHFTTARDLALITRYAMKNPLFREIVSTRIHATSFIRADGTEKSFDFINHNKLLGSLDGCIGVKTGYTSLDGRCLVSAVSRDGAEYIAVTLDCPEDWAEHRELHEYAFSNTRMVSVVRAGDCIKYALCNGVRCRLVAEDDFNVPVNGSYGRDFELRLNLPRLINMPLNAHEKIGEIEIYDGDNYIGEVDVVAEAEFKPGSETEVRTSFWYSMIIILRNTLG